MNKTQLLSIRRERLMGLGQIYKHKVFKKKIARYVRGEDW